MDEKHATGSSSNAPFYLQRMEVRLSGVQTDVKSEPFLFFKAERNAGGWRSLVGSDAAIK
jgi:hypothetical protein